MLNDIKQLHYVWSLLYNIMKRAESRNGNYSNGYVCIWNTFEAAFEKSNVWWLQSDYNRTFHSSIFNDIEMC